MKNGGKKKKILSDRQLGSLCAAITADSRLPFGQDAVSGDSYFAISSSVSASICAVLSSFKAERICTVFSV